MHAGRLLPYRLSLLLLAGSGLAGCVSDRYVGSIGHDGTYSNRGYGFAVFLSKGDLDARWSPLDPRSPEAAPRGLRPIVYDAPLDLDGDGMLSMTETTRFLRPALLLLSKARPTATMSIDVMILPIAEKRATLDALLRRELVKAIGTSSIADEPAKITEVTLPSEFRARIGEVHGGSRAFRVAVIDQAPFISESGRARRQIVRILLTAPQITPELRQDHDLLLSAMLLNRKSGPETAQEKW